MDPASKTYAFAYQAVQQTAPSASGVYTIYTPQQWVYVGESDDLRQSLLQLLNERNGHCMARWGPLWFSFETVPSTNRASRLQALVTALRPACNPA